MMPGFQPKNVSAIRANVIVCVAKVGDLRAKAFQIFFGKDESLFVSFPYFRHRIGILSSSAIPGDGERESDVSMERGGKVTSHRVKYSHHPSGQAHFSQTDKIRTEIKRQSSRLDTLNGHIFSLLIQGLGSLAAADAIKDRRTSSKRTLIDFCIDPQPEAIKFVGRWYDVNSLRVSDPESSIGPAIPMVDSRNNKIDSMLLASPHADARHVLAISCVPVPRLGPDPEIFMFYGGFDSGEVMTDPHRQAGFLAFRYPLSEAKNARERLGSVDYFPGE
jgi:hypothetical protein